MVMLSRLGQRSSSGNVPAFHSIACIKPVLADRTSTDALRDFSKPDLLPKIPFLAGETEAIGFGNIE